MDPRIWAAGWQDRIRAIVQSHGYSNVFDFVIQNPNLSFGQLFKKLQSLVPEGEPQIAFSQLHELFYVDAVKFRQLEIAFSEALVRSLQIHFRHGWNKGKNVEKRRVGVLMDWPYPSTVLFPSSSGDEKQWRKAQEDLLELLDQRVTHDDWCPENTSDPVIQEAINNVLHLHESKYKVN